ncbi:MAG: tetratricopeptide repeat protein [Phenylobacterium sp.]|uniref:tetratricopeptide repeat protein n=1 Tax=Phenylobacterium sp. TaxID=1871053 RepID=UPI002A2E9DEA|nr:tetratricopeptide repeat protein [Phenylobacterium sp.]MDD3836830.1 tetratricopeptide repeat protein [Phenylobacterium sp.]MDX9998236.1 tetratricopeptide repeat protein [Phenylobacterium sp.]
MVDLFEEVEEQLRSDRYKTLALKALPWALGALAAALLIALGVWGYQEYRQRAAEAASEQYAQALEVLQQGRTEEADKLFGEVADSPSRAYKALALMHQGGIRMTQGKRDEAVKLYDAAAEAAPDVLLGDAARLKSAFALMDSASLAQIQERLEPLSKEDRPYRILAEEALAIAKLSAGDFDGARKDFSALKDLLDAPEGVRQRATVAVELIDSGTAKALPETLKAAAALPEPAAPASQQPAPRTQ